MRAALLLPLAFLLAACAAAYAGNEAAPSAAPVAAAPDTSGGFENLQIFPDSISHDRLMAIMDAFTVALDVRCTFCHVREEGELQFASDANPHKDVARGMLRMTARLNGELLPQVEGLDGAQVTCWTCHRGSTHPETELPDMPDDDQ